MNDKIETAIEMLEDILDNLYLFEDGDLNALEYDILDVISVLEQEED